MGLFSLSLSLSSLSELRKHPDPPRTEDEGCGLTEECAPGPGISASPGRSGSRGLIRHTHCAYTPCALSVCAAYRGGITVEVVPTFSARSARHSEQHGPDKQQTSRRLHLLRPRRVYSMSEPAVRKVPNEARASSPSFSLLLLLSLFFCGTFSEFLSVSQSQ